jgi:hypothetical protein
LRIALAWHVNAGPPFDGIDAHTSDAAPGSQNVYSLCVGSHVVVWQATLKYCPLVSSVPQHTAPAPLHCAESEQGRAVWFPFSHAPLVLLTHA